MDNLKAASVEWAVTHIRRYGDTDLLPVPFEYEAIKHSWPKLRDAILDIDLTSYEARPYKRFLIPKQYGGFRVAIQLDPVDTIIYTALAYEAAESIENYRVPIDRKIACSYRISIDPRGQLFRNKNGWDDYHSISQIYADSNEFAVVLTADIADFYNQIGHHRVRNALEMAGVSPLRAENIENLLMNFTRGQSQGIPIGPSASIIFAEACLSDVDNYLLRRGYVHTRYIDDFRIFCTDIEHANKALHDLTEYLYTSHRLPIQAHKTKILSIVEFKTHELIDPEELEEKTKEEKISAIFSQIPEYAELDWDDSDDEDSDDWEAEEAVGPKNVDIDHIVRANLVELFSASIEQEPLHLGMAKYLLRRATSLRTGVLRNLVLDNLTLLIPIIREVALYIMSTTNAKYATSIGRRFIAGCEKSDFMFLQSTQSWVLELLVSKMNHKLEAEISELCNTFKHNLGIRPFALLAKSNFYIDWVREQKETWQNNNPWDRRAIIWASQALSQDEMKNWLSRVSNAGDILDKAIAEAALHLKNN